MFRVNNKDTRTTPMRRSGVFIVNFEHVSPLVLFLLLTLNKLMPAVSAINSRLNQFRAKYQIDKL